MAIDGMTTIRLDDMFVWDELWQSIQTRTLAGPGFFFTGVAVPDAAMPPLAHDWQMLHALSDQLQRFLERDRTDATRHRPHAPFRPGMRPITAFR